MKRKFLSMLLALAMVFTLLPTVALAESTDSCSDNCQHEAAIGTTHYDTLAGAIAAAAADKTVTLLKDVELTSQVVIDKAITLYGGNYTIKAADSFAPAAHLVDITGNGAKIQNVKLDSNKKAWGLQVYKATGVTVENVTLLNSAKNPMNVNASQATIEGTLTVDGENAWGNGINVNWGQNISDVSYKCTLTVDNDAVLNGVSAIYTDDDDVTRSGGTFETKFSIALPSNWAVTTLAGKAKIYAPAVAEVNGTKYATLADAIAAADGKTVTLLKPVTVDSEIKIDSGKNITLDLNGQTITCTKSGSRVFQNYGTFTIKSSASGGAISNTNPAAYGIVDNRAGGTFTSDGVTYFDIGFDNGAALKNRVGGTMTVKNGSITTNGTPQIGLDNIGNAGISSEDNLTVNNCTITTVGHGIAFWGNNGTPAGRQIQITDTNITMSGYHVTSVENDNIYYGGNIIDLAYMKNGTITISGCTLKSTCLPADGYGPGIVVLGCPGSTLNISNTSISSLSGEAIKTQNQGGALTINMQNSTAFSDIDWAIALLGSYNAETAGRTVCNMTANSVAQTNGSEGVSAIYITRGSEINIDENSKVLANNGGIGIAVADANWYRNVGGYGSAMKSSVVCNGIIEGAYGIVLDEDCTMPVVIAGTESDAVKNWANNNKSAIDAVRGPVSITLGANSIINATEVGIQLDAKAQADTAEEIALANPNISIADGAVINAPEKGVKGNVSAATAETMEKIFAAKTTVTYVYNNGAENLELKQAVGEMTLADAPTRSGYYFAGWSDGTQTYAAGASYTVGTTAVTLTAQWTAIPTDTDSGSSGGSSSGSKTETVKNPDGSTTTTVTDKKTGTVTETTTGKPVTDEDGNTTQTKTETVTKKDGSTTETVTETVKGADGSTSETQTVVSTDKDGATTTTETVKATDPTGTTATKTTETNAEGETTTSVEAAVSDKALTEAAKDGAPVTLPVEVAAPKAAEADSAPVVKVEVPSAVSTENTIKVEIPVENPTLGTVAIIVKEDGTEEIVKTSVLGENGVVLTLDGSATVKIVDNSKEFVDVHPVDHWAGDTIDFVASREIFSGTGENTFSPDVAMTRAMLMTVLARYDGEDTTTGDTWYEKGMDWAKANGVSDGTNPDANITREQLATMLYRYAGSPEHDGAIDRFPDADAVSSYAAEAMRWAVANGLIDGMDDGTLNPQGDATRAQVAAVLARFCSNQA